MLDTCCRCGGLTIPLHTDRVKLVGESERLLAAGERGRYQFDSLDKLEYLNNQFIINFYFANKESKKAF